MKKLLLSLAIASAITGCGGGETLEDVKNDNPPVLPTATVKFDPANSVISVPNDLLMSGTLDGTLNIPGELDDNNVSVERAAYADPQLALGALDGWSTQTPFKIDLTFPAGISLDMSSAASPGAVRIFEVVMGASQTDETCSQVPAGIACKLVSELTFGVDFVTQGSGDAVAVIPLKPFKAGSTYINVLTTSLMDSEGRSIEPSSTYALVSEETPLITDSQKSLQAVINSYENTVTSGGAITKDEIIYSAAMTMQSAGQVLGTVKQLLAASLTQDALPTPMVQIPEQPVITVEQVFASQGITGVSPVFGGVQYQKGSVMLPMYLATPTGTTVDDLSATYWQGLCDSGVAVLGYAAAAGDSFPTDPISETDGLCMALSGGKLRDLGLDQTKHLTKYNTIPKTQSIANVPVQITKPILPVINAVRAQLGLDALSMPETGWPVVILQHGITSKKEDMLAITAQLTMQGFATAAIDHPMHGERGVDVDGDGTDDFNASTGSVLSYMNLQSLLVARDSLRQSVADLLGLRLGLNFTGAADLNAQDVSFLGHSLGSVVAPAFVAVTNAPLADQVDPMFNVKSVALASGGGGIASFLIESNTFGPFVQGSVLLAAGIDESAEFGAYTQNEALSNCGALAANQTAFVTCAYKEYIGALTVAGETAKLANIQSVITQFAFAAQTALDSGDPSNYASSVAALGTPVYMSVVVGDGANNNADMVIPPTVSSNPIAGSLPLANLMGLSTVAETQGPTADAMSYVVKFTKGHHSSVLTPVATADSGATAEESAAATAEMQLQIATFLASRGQYLQVTNPDVVTE
ncbi:VolA/Pla-1 family phospholipase [uncultured Pseudoalteromonas sp.]|uniref:VolA/Pla-1 family phospholipase n=1 Tax=uncultured Pseudoalteromonas sp. TaxID=114053 RepID=UPI002585CEA1|nr:VolA/Pla-1 family phospholipase [uncultured Pseudoalteromonas sp.]